MHSDTSNNRGEQLNNFGSGSARLFRRAAMATRMITLMLLCLLLLLATTSQLTQGQTESVIYSSALNLAVRTGPIRRLACYSTPRASAGLIRDSKGNLYGTARNGGVPNDGTVFKLTKSGKFTTLHSFAGPPSDGAQPVAGLVMDKQDNLYGTTFQGGAYGYGVVFKVSPTGTATVLYSFTGGADGSEPGAGLVIDKKGNLYGTTPEGGAYDKGVVFKITQ